MITKHAIQPNSAVLLYFDLKLADKQLADSIRRTGCSLSAELDWALLGLRVGSRKGFALTPEAAFSQPPLNLI
ncbi:MAG: hypothetical protein ACTXOO_04095 [Sodalis sp. (in: enterobacteria)]